MQPFDDISDAEEYVLGTETDDPERLSRAGIGRVMIRKELAKLREVRADMLHELQQIHEWATVERIPLREQEIASIRALIAKVRKDA